VLTMGIPAQGQHRGVLEQEQHVPDALLFAQLAYLLLQGLRFAVVQATEIDQRDNHSSANGAV
jgi:hypothetical protein